MKINPSIQSIIDPPLDIMNKKIAQMQQAGEDVISLAQGVSSFAPPKGAISQVMKALEDGAVNGYSHDAGILEVREALADYLSFKGDKPDPETELLLTAGASQAFFSALMTIGEPGGKVVLPSPYYFDHQFAVLACGMTPVEVPMVSSGTKWSFDIPAMTKALDEGAKVLVLVSPNNPTGAVITEKDLNELSGAVVRNSAVIISDETYDRFVFSPNRFVSPRSIPALEDSVITIGSFSKNYALAGWRIGYLLGPDYVIKEALKLQDTLVICAPVISQTALLGAINGDGEQVISSGLAELEERRNILSRYLSNLEKIRWYEPSGAFFAFPAFSYPCDDQLEVFRILEEAKVAVMAGSACGAFGRGHFRISFGNVPAGDLEEACKRLAAFFQ